MILPEPSCTTTRSSPSGSTTGEPKLPHRYILTALGAVLGAWWCLASVGTETARWMLLRRHGWHIADTNPSTCRMGAYKYLGELYKKKQSDVLRFLLRVRCDAVQPVI